jgi:anti-sigma-K factor RskA
MIDPRSRAVLAGEYVLGVLSPAVRARFERMMRHDPALARLADEWARRFAPIDEATAPVIPPSRVWRAIEAKTIRKPARAATKSAGWRESLAVWRMVAVGGLAAAVVLLVVLATGIMSPSPPHIIAVLADKDGAPGWVISEDGRGKTLAVEAVNPRGIDADHAFELWCMAAGKPWALGVIPTASHRRVTIPAWEIPSNGAAFAVSIEEPGGSRSGRPTGPVVYQGAILAD